MSERSSKYIQVPHYCPEWDYLEIYPGTPEFDVCICKKESENKGDEDDLSKSNK